MFAVQSISEVSIKCITILVTGPSMMFEGF